MARWWEMRWRRYHQRAQFLAEEKDMKMLGVVAAVAMAGMSVAGVAAEKNTFTLLHKDKVAGKCVYSIEKTKKGYAVKTQFQARGMSDSATTDGEGKGVSVSDTQQTAEYKLDDQMNFVEGFVMDQGTRMNTSYMPDKAGTKMTVAKIQQGVAGDPTDVPLKAGFLVAPEYDASVMQVLLLKAMTHATADKMYYLVTPAKRGNASASSAQWTAVADAAATLGGKDVMVHHYTVLAGKSKYELYGDDANTLMQAKVGSNTYVREGFALKAKEEEEKE